MEKILGQLTEQELIQYNAGDKSVTDKYLKEGTKGMPNDSVIKKQISDTVDGFIQDTMDWAMKFDENYII